MMPQRTEMRAPLRFSSEDLGGLTELLRDRAREHPRPIVVALDGRSGSGKSTLAQALVRALDATLVDGDGFFAGGVVLRADSPEQRASDCIDWQRQRPVLEALRAGLDAHYFAFDWEAFDGRLELTPTRVVARRIIIIEGVYSARPELSDLIDCRMLRDVSDELRLSRLLAREGAIGSWERQWHEAEDWYFAHAAPPSGFDVIVEG